MVGLARANPRSVQVVRLQQPQPALALHDALCAPGHDDDLQQQHGAEGPPLLLLPPGFELLDAEAAAGQLSELLMVGAPFSNQVGQ